MKRNVALLVKGSLAYALAYLVSGGLAYQLLTKPFYVGDDPIFAAYLRSEAVPEEWAHVNAWLIPGLLIRSLLIVAVLLPFVEALEKAAFYRRVATLFAVLFVLAHLAAAAPSPSNIEGLVYMRPDLVGLRPFLLTQPEMLLQCLLFAFGFSWLIRSPKER